MIIVGLYRLLFLLMYFPGVKQNHNMNILLSVNDMTLNGGKK